MNGKSVSSRRRSWNESIFASLNRSSFKTVAACTTALLTTLNSPPAAAADVDITANTTTVNLDTETGTTVRVFPGVTVSNGISATTQPWTLTNDGAVNGSNSVALVAGGGVTNNPGASISGTLTAVRFGTVTAGPGTLNNFGTITGGAGEGVTLFFGGTVTNHADATISTATGLNAVSIGQGTSRVLMNSGTISATRTTGFSTGVLMQGGPSTFTNTSSGVIYGDFNGLYGSATAVFTFNNAGSINSARGPAVEAWGGGTFVNTGTIGSINSHGILIRNNSNADITNSGTISGAVNAISFADTGGVATAAVHTLRLQTGSVLNGNVLGGANTDNLILNGTGAETIAKFLNFETVSMQGTNWTLTGTGIFSTNAEVQSGVLLVNGQLSSPTVTVQSAGTLGGIGTIVGAVTNSGTIAPGNSIGTLNIVGGYTQASGSRYNVEVSAAPAADLINVTGAATIQASSGVHVFAAPGMYTVGQRYTILTASGGVTGTYATLTDDAPFVDFGLFYDSNNVYLDVLRASAAFASIARTPNQRAAATGIEGLGSGNPIFDSIVGLNTPNALRAFDLLSGEIHASIQSGLLDDSRFIREGIFARLRQSAGGIGPASGPQIIASYAAPDTAGQALAYAARKRAPAKAAIAEAMSTKAPPPAGPVVTVWSQGFGSFGTFDTDGNAASMRRRTGGIISGIDTTFAGTFGQAWRVGIAGGYQSNSMSVGDRASSAAIDTYHLAAYTAAQHGPFALRLGAAHAWHSIDTTRNIAYPGFSDVTKASYDGHTTQVFGELGRTLNYGAFALEPYAALAHVRVSSDGFSEKGGAAALAALAANTSVTFSTLGLRAAVPFAAGNAPDVLLKGGLGWRHAFNAAPPAMQFAFAGGTPFVIAGVPIARDAFVTEAGFDMAVGGNATIGLSYASQHAGNAREYGIRGQALKRF